MLKGKEILYNSEEYLSVTLLLLIFILTVVGIFSRYLFGVSIGVIDELTRFMLVWFTFLGTVFVKKTNDSHISMENVYNYFFKKYPKLTYSSKSILISVCLIYVIYQGIKLSIKYYVFSLLSLHIPVSYLYISIPVCFLLYIIEEYNQFSKYMIRTNSGQKKRC